MKANELRLGNIVGFYKPTLTGLQHAPITEIFHNGTLDGMCVGFEHLNYINIESGIKPIPLTEEWLLKFGFESYYKNGSEYQDKNMYLVKNGDIWQNLKIGVNLEHVHQLQNLYFALTGEELTIK